MKRVISLAAILLAFNFNSFTQITSNPGTNVWSSPTAWNGGIVPSSTDAVIIGPNSTIALDVPVNHNANIEINGGSLMGISAANDLTVNNANLTIVGFSSTLNFAGAGGAVPVTINNGNLVNGGVYMAGATYISHDTGGASSNDGDFMITGDLTLDSLCVFDNNVGMSVSGTVSVSEDAEYYNHMSASSGIVANDGAFENFGSYTVSDSIYNGLTGELITDGTGLFVTNNVHNAGAIEVYDSLQIGTDFSNFMFASITCDSAAVNIEEDFYNLGIVEGEGGYYYIGMNSENDNGGVIDGNIDVCDATLSAGQHLDTNAGWQTVNYATVTFCTTSYASLDKNELLNIEVYPNPVENTIFISSESAGVAVLIANDGKEIVRAEISDQNNSIDVSALPNGVYILKLNTANGQLTKKVIKL